MLDKTGVYESLEILAEDLLDAGQISKETYDVISEIYWNEMTFYTKIQDVWHILHRMRQEKRLRWSGVNEIWRIVDEV